MSNLAEAAACVKPAGAGIGIEGVEADGVGGPGVGPNDCLMQEQAADPLALKLGKDGHAGEVDCLVYRREVIDIDGPGFLVGQAHGSYNAFSIARDDNQGIAHAVEHASFGWWI